MHSSCNIICQWTWQEIPYIKGLECYENILITILVVVWCWTNISWAPYVVPSIILPPNGIWWWWCDVNLVEWFQIGSICIIFLLSQWKIAIPPCCYHERHPQHHHQHHGWNWSIDVTFHPLDIHNVVKNLPKKIPWNILRYFKS